MIEFYYETEFKIENEAKVSEWISNTIIEEGFELGEIVYVFCDDTYLHRLNVEFLNHDTLTDIISFDYSMGKLISGEIYISIERVLDNSNDFDTTFLNELNRVIIHGILHFCGYKDKDREAQRLMRAKEDEALLRLID
ncbi:rRNA maturation RNase YbeY [Aequorivita echinoideorum]|uniref:Endoribonuclease YbeY n=1 Tax=Aequorivita echinoideorum TaxID=1549647 RepID=A0ABS5S3X9_9FLAO|nr:rRNA maturation RNase YbeY [Aequorivita echinoideorum]MBT0607140.1 rRNA maturation RNase YbeY [Aequorivita echinoideorum]